MPAIQNVGNICKACELDTLDPRKMLKRKGGFIWLLVAIVAILLLVKFLVVHPKSDGTQEMFMHEVR
jgi:hypothetical protein